MYRFISLIIVLGCLTFSCQNNYHPVYKDKWAQVDQNISSQWDVFVSTNEMLPYPFTDALEGGLMYYWDLYFIQKGLLLHQEKELALSNLNNLIFQVDTFGYIPNAQISWGMDRSQPPFLSMIVYDYYFHLPPHERNKEWLKRAYDACLKEYHFWTDTAATALENHNTPIAGLQRYYHHAEDNVLEGVFDAIGAVRFKGYPVPATKEEKINFGANVIAECASGYDFTPRFQREIINYIPLELNVNLWKYEMNFPEFEKELGVASAKEWNKLAEKRKELINRYCWNEERGLYTDYNFVKKEQNPVASYATFYPLLWKMASHEQAKRISANLPLLEREPGVVFCEDTDSSISYQWNSHAIWPPVQYVVYKGLENYDYKEDAKRIAAKYLDLVTKNYLNPYPKKIVVDGKKQERPPGGLYEKYDNQGNILDGSDYPSGTMIGWCGGVFVDAYHLLESSNVPGRNVNKAGL